MAITFTIFNLFVDNVIKLKVGGSTAYVTYVTFDNMIVIFALVKGIKYSCLIPKVMFLISGSEFKNSLSKTIFSTDALDHLKTLVYI